jgi:CBS domain-containing protein
MAGNPKWCQPLDNWKKYFSTWINIPGPSELLEVSIFFDFGYCFGDKSLSDALREYIQADLKASDIFFHHLSTVLKQFNPSIRDLSGETMDIKKLLLPLTGIIRLYALKYGTDGYSTIERILALHEGKYMDAHLLREALKAWKDLTSLRLSHQASCIQKGIEPDNRINIQISDNENIIFAEQAMITINNMMLKTGTDFYTAEI